MSTPDIPFNSTTASNVRNTFNATAEALDEQATSRSAAASTIMDEFKGPYATVYEENTTHVPGDISKLAHAMREVGYLMDRAIEAYEEAKADAEKNMLEQAGDAIADFFGFGDDPQVPPGPYPPVSRYPFNSVQEHTKWPGGDRKHGFGYSLPDP